ncbi:hypothetical protein RND81_12G108700 [Saponaria officinalis]|uniref:Uncharacterized protein n=2 Tax=Saponaria officinalis TaxID=3572 RepID=A0AAW1H926_SAPOF
MAPKIATVATLTPSKARYQLIARVTRIWEVAGNEDGKPYSLDMILLDQEGNHIHATIPRRLINNYSEMVKEGIIYKIQHFEVATTARSYRPVTSTTNIIKWTPFTSIIEDKQNRPIANHKFEFHPLDNLAERTNKVDYLIDVIGLLTTIEEKTKTTTSKGETQLRHIHIVNERKKSVRVTLWGNTADLIDENAAMDDPEDKVIIITSAKVVDYKGENQLQSTYATKVYLNLDTTETNRLKQRDDKPRQVTFIANENPEAEVPEQKTITELIEMDMPNEEQQFLCKGVITEVRTDVEWRYLSCTTCKSGLNEERKCHKCNNKIDYPTQRYRIMAIISDGTAAVNIVIFNKEAEKVIGKPIGKLLDISEKEEGKEQVYEILRQCEGKQYTFKVKVAVSKYNNERELKVQKTITIDEQYKESKANYKKENEDTTDPNSVAMANQEEMAQKQMQEVAQPTEDKDTKKLNKQELDRCGGKGNTSTTQTKRKREDTTHNE